jgi:uridine kinase
MLVVDGLYAIKTDHIDMRVFIDLTYHETKMTQIIRGKEPLNEYRAQVLEREHQNVSSLKSLADLIVNKNYEVEAVNGQFTK